MLCVLVLCVCVKLYFAAMCTENSGFDTGCELWRLFFFVIAIVMQLSHIILRSESDQLFYC